MAKIDEKYEIRLATRDDIEDIMEFIGSVYRKDHILSVDRAFFEYEFLESDNSVNYVIGINRQTGKIDCIRGFYRSSHTEGYIDIWGCLWTVRPGSTSMLSLELFKQSQKLSNCRYDLGVGENPKTVIPIFKVLMHRTIGAMRQYYMLAEMDEYKIAKVNQKCRDVEKEAEKAEEKNVAFEVRKVTSIDELKSKFNFEKYKEIVPYKDAWYIQHRFFEHPVYKYQVYGIYSEEEIHAFFVIRVEIFQDREVVRLVDYIGEHQCIADIKPFFKELLAVSNREYIDFYTYGFEEEYLLDAGFSLRDDSVIIPNYFHPFEQKNIEILVSATTEKFQCFKADSDQDRPN